MEPSEGGQEGYKLTAADSADHSEITQIEQQRRTIIWINFYGQIIALGRRAMLLTNPNCIAFVLKYIKLKSI